MWGEDMVANENIFKAASSLKNGGIAVFPTETVYGIGVVYNSENAYKKLLELKKRPPEKPFSMMFKSLEQARGYLDASPRLLKTMERFLPGEVTFLCRAKWKLPHQCDHGSGIIGVRVPSGEVARLLMEAVDEPCLVTSANLSGEPAATTLGMAKDYFPTGVDAYVDGPCESNLATTIVDCVGFEPRLIRAGKIKFEDILKAWEEAS